MPAGDALARLSAAGIARADLALACGIGEAVARRLLRGTVTPSPRLGARIDALTACLDALAAVPLAIRPAEPAPALGPWIVCAPADGRACAPLAWCGVCVHPDASLVGFDLLAMGRTGLLVRLARTIAAGGDGVALMERTIPEALAAAPRDRRFVVVMAGDGCPSIVPRSSIPHA